MSPIDRYLLAVNAAGGAQLAPLEIDTAREKRALANQAIVDTNHLLDVDSASQVQAAAKLTQGSANSGKTAQKLANELRQNPRCRVLVEGFTDSAGATHNQELLERGATAVHGARQELGVSPERVARCTGTASPIRCLATTRWRVFS